MVTVEENTDAGQPVVGDEQFPHLDAGTRAVLAALGERFAPGIDSWVDLFSEDAVLEAVFDEGAAPYRGRPALAQLGQALAGRIFFETVNVDEVIDGADGRTFVYTSRATFTRADLQGRYHHSYVFVARFQAGRISHLREYGGPLRFVAQLA